MGPLHAEKRTHLSPQSALVGQKVVFVLLPKIPQSFLDITPKPLFGLTAYALLNFSMRGEANGFCLEERKGQRASLVSDLTNRFLSKA